MKLAGIDASLIGGFSSCHISSVPMATPFGHRDRTYAHGNTKAEDDDRGGVARSFPRHTRRTDG
jgi:hypothetical protein